MAGRTQPLKLIWSRQALKEREAIWQFLAEANVAYADRVEARIVTRTDRLLAAPFQGSPVARTDQRKLSIPDIQYVIVYRVEDNAIRILRIWATSQDRGQ
jgi:toxin ParE1/3/4